MSETHTAVLDRIVDGASAVLLLERGENAAVEADAETEVDPEGETDADSDRMATDPADDRLEGDVDATGDRSEGDSSADQGEDESGDGDADQREDESGSEDATQSPAEDTDRTVIDELVVDVDALPADGRHEGAVFTVRVDRDEGALLEATYRADAERERRESTRERFDRLSERLPDE